MPLSIGREVLGEGGAGTVYVGRYFGDDVAVKVRSLSGLRMKERDRVAKEAMKEVMKEVAIMADLPNHKRVIQVYGWAWYLYEN